MRLLKQRLTITTLYVEQAREEDQDVHWCEDNAAVCGDQHQWQHQADQSFPHHSNSCADQPGQNCSKGELSSHPAQRDNGVDLWGIATPGL